MLARMRIDIRRVLDRAVSLWRSSYRNPSRNYFSLRSLVVCLDHGRHLVCIMYPGTTVCRCQFQVHVHVRLEGGNDTSAHAYYTWINVTYVPGGWLMPVGEINQAQSRISEH